MASEEIDYYAVLGCEPLATLQQIKSAYRQRSLKVHPDRNPDNPRAAVLFHELRQAFDILQDPTTRASFDALHNARIARKARFQGLDNKRKLMAQDLERREMEFKQQKQDQGVEKMELDRLKEDGRRRREQVDLIRRGKVLEEQQSEKEVEKEQRRKERALAKEEQSGVIDLGPLDLTLRLKWSTSAHPSLITSDALSHFITSALAVYDPEIDSLLLSSKFLKNPTKGKHGSGVVAFKSLRATLRVVEAAKGSKGVWEGMEVNWASGAAPECLGGSSTVNDDTAAPSVAAPLPSIFSNPDEERILAQLRAKERAKLIAELEISEAAET